MKLITNTDKASDIVCDTLLVGIFEGSTLQQDTLVQEIDELLDGYIGELLINKPSRTQYGETSILHTLGKLKAKQLVLYGLGKIEHMTIDRMRAISAVAARTAGKQPGSTAALLLKQEYSEIAPNLSVIQAVAEGIYLGLYEFSYYKTTKPRLSLDTVYLAGHGINLPGFQEVLNKAAVITDCVCLARDLVNHPSCYLTPSRFVEIARDIAKTQGLSCSVLQADEIHKQGLHALWAVAKGSDEPPALITLKYIGAPENAELIAYVGKGITFDSGGISLKPSAGMGEMKDDMGGAAAVLAAMKGISQLKPKVNIIAVIPCAENMPSGRALKPGDVITSLNGKTIEIISTDAEGRLILADAISFAIKLGATKIVDLATLTGACVVALGKIASAIISNDESWCNCLLEAAKQSGEKMWRLPAYDEYKEQLKSEIADLKNSGGRPAGAITAGLFLAEFTEDRPWVHIDIAGAVTSDKERGYNPKGATGVGVRTLIQVAEQNG